MSLKAFLASNGIPTRSAAGAVNEVRFLDNRTVDAILAKVGVTVVDRLQATRMVVNAIMTGCEDNDRIQTYVYSKVGKYVPRAVYVAPQAMLTPELGEISDSLKPYNLSTMQAVTIRKARRKTGSSGYDRSVTILDANPTAGRDERINLLVAQGIAKASALVYLWKYNKGER